MKASGSLHSSREVVQHRALGRRGLVPLPAVPPLEPTKGEQMDFTETEAEILVNAWLLAREGKGQVVEDWAEPDAERLCEAGWLERRRTVDANGDTCWFWTREAEPALDMNALRRDDPADMN
jgi:hypothetical protein